MSESKQLPGQDRGPIEEIKMPIDGSVKYLDWVARARLAVVTIRRIRPCLVQFLDENFEAVGPSVEVEGITINTPPPPEGE